jgi:Tfp pilus assembly protein PilE
VPIWLWIVVLVVAVALAAYRRYSEKSALQRRHAELAAQRMNRPESTDQSGRN